MKIALIGQKGIPAHFGGVERHVHDLAVRLVQSGASVIAYGRAWYTGDTPERYEGVRLVYTRGIRTKHLDTFTHTFTAVIHALREGVDVIHFHGVGPALWSWIPRLFAKEVTVVTTFHSIDRKHEKWGFFARLALRCGEYAACHFAHRTIAVSKTIAQYTRDVYDTESSYIPNAIEFYEPEECTDVLDAFGIESCRYVLAVSRFIPHKGIHYLIEAWQGLRDRGALPEDLRLVIVGDGYHTDAYAESLQNVVRHDDHIVFTGFQSGRSLRTLFSHAKLMVHPSDKEGLPITVLEAMGYALPVLLSDIPEHIEIGVSPQMRFRHGDVQDLKDVLLRVLKKSDRSMKIMGTKNRRVVEENYSWKVVTRNILQLYRQALRKRARHRSRSLQTLKTLP